MRRVDLPLKLEIEMPLQILQQGTIVIIRTTKCLQVIGLVGFHGMQNN